MPRNISAGMITALVAPVVRPFLLVQINLASTALNVWSGIGNLTWNAITWSGVGDFGSVSTLSEDSTIEAKGVTISLSGVPITDLTDTLTEVRMLKTASVYLGCFDENHNIIPDPILAYQGRVDLPTLDDSGETCSITINVENVLVDLNRSVFRRYTNEDQQLDYPGDTGFRFVPTIQEYTMTWGVLPNASNR